MSRGDLSINVIIVAVIGMIVLFVLVGIFLGKIRIWGANVEGSCTQQGGMCMTQKDLGCPSERPIVKWANGCDCLPKGEPECNNQKLGQCCLPVLK